MFGHAANVIAIAVLDNFVPHNQIYIKSFSRISRQTYVKCQTQLVTGKWFGEQFF